MRTLLFITFPQGFRISKNIGHLTWKGEVGEKRRLKGTLKVNTQTDRRTDRQTDGHADGHFGFSPEGGCFENGCAIYGLSQGYHLPVSVSI